MRSDIIPGAVFPRGLGSEHAGLRQAWDAGDLSQFHRWDRKGSEPAASA
jgi:hypothetical protein